MFYNCAPCVFREVLHNELTWILHPFNSEDKLRSNGKIFSNYGFLQLFIILLEISNVNLSLNNRSMFQDYSYFNSYKISI